MNKRLGVFGAVAGLVSALILTTGMPSFGDSFKPGCTARSGADNVTHALPWAGDQSVEIRVPGAVHFEVGPEWGAIATGPTAILQHLQFSNGRLEFDQPLNLCDVDLKITLTGPAVRQWTLAGSGTLALKHLNQTDLDITVAGSGFALATGTVERTRAMIRGSGDAWLGRLAVKDASVRISGSGNVDIAAENSADIEIHGSGNVRLLKQPRTVQKWIQGSGNITGAG